MILHGPPTLRGPGKAYRSLNDLLDGVCGVITDRQKMEAQLTQLPELLDGFLKDLLGLHQCIDRPRKERELEEQASGFWEHDFYYLEQRLQNWCTNPPGNYECTALVDAQPRVKEWLTQRKKIVPRERRHLTTEEQREQAVADSEREIEQLRSSVRGLEVNAAIASDKAISAEQRLARPVQLKSIYVGLWITGFLLVSGVILPLSLLPSAQFRGRPSWHYWVLAPFVVFVVSMILYLRSLAEQLKPPREKD